MQICSINWGSVADWVSGIGSLSAASIALYLARRSERIRLRGYCGFRDIIGMGQPKREVLCISATNVGTRATVINNIGMRVGMFKKRQAVIAMMPTPISAGVPQQLTDGQSASWHIPLDEQRAWVAQLCGTFIKSKSDVRTLRFTLHTNHGGVLVLVPEEPVREALLQMLARNNG